MTDKVFGGADVRALVGASVIGTVMGLALGGAYMAGSKAQATDADARAHARFARLADAAKDRFSERSLRAEASGMDAGAVALAARNDPLLLAAADRDESVMTARLEQAKPQAMAAATSPEARPPLLLASFTKSAPPVAAQPFRLSGGALESSRDLDCLAEAVYYEARGEGASGQAAVAQVVLNRVRHPAFPKTVCGVVFQGAQTATCQFSFACNGAMRRPREAGAWSQARSIAARALAGYVMPQVGSATHFHVAGYGAGWGLLKVAQVGLHVFYRFGGGAGALIAAPERSAPEVQVADKDAPAAASQPILASLIPMVTPAKAEAAPVKPPVQLASAVMAPVAATTGAVAALANDSPAHVATQGPSAN